MDDLFIHPTFSYTENVDYMGASNIPNHHLHLCWKQNNSITIKSHHDDISLIIPSTISRRLENICWRRWNKQLHALSEVSPATINWNKNQDITWLYGPKYEPMDFWPDDTDSLTHDNLQKMHHSESDMDIDDISSLGLVRSMSFDDVSLIETDDENDEYETYGLKLALRHPHMHTTKKLVKFSYIVNLREFVNGILFDYDFLDTLCL